ncbi:MAG: hypothetical protein M0Z99_28635 [Betaproteobacteria bacterium]|nr:hypothetical protein [Betaproteobacteria bacterium]
MSPDPNAKLQKLQEKIEKLDEQIREDIYAGRGVNRSLVDQQIDLAEQQQQILGITPPDSKTKR